MSKPDDITFQQAKMLQVEGLLAERYMQLQNYTEEKEDEIGGHEYFLEHLNRYFDEIRKAVRKIDEL